MDSTFGNVFLFLTDLAWKSRLTIPLLVTTAFLVMDIRLQIEINIQTGQVNASDLDEPDDAFEEQLAHGAAFAMEEESDVYTDDLEEYNSEYTNGDGNSSDTSRYSVDIDDDLGSEYDVENDLDAYYASEIHF
ncbi:uncharacterized protein [Drosophila virilis]|uniref:Uncharacterized protein n=1 Tax=Drosophila virilis TaxID=7244 RepID=B4MB97_DROVI|nr:uncharacterized protein LOC6635211 [Drosophila virilis]EDW58368.1 uncharacterized protein Dvir_GJ14392 [Drosophila virilis]